MQKKKLVDEVRNVARMKHLSLKTEKAYINWIKRFIFFHNKKHPREMGVNEIRAFLSHLATQRKVAASTQNQALSALLFLYRQVLKIDLPYIANIEKANKPKKIPVVFSPVEVEAIFSNLGGRPKLMAGLLYGSGLRLMECVRLRVKDVDFYYHQIVVRNGKGNKDRITILPESLEEQLTAVRDTPQSMFVEAFRAVRTNLQFTSTADRQRTIVITSPGPEDGKTTVACNLAAMVAQGPKCHLRR